MCRFIALAICLFVLPARGAVVAERPFDAPPDMQTYVRHITLQQPSQVGKAQAILKACFGAQEDGGLGIVYDNDHTRTVEEVWHDRKANCLGLTAFFIASCRSIGIECQFAESPSISQWRRVGNLIRHELHVVAVVKQLPLPDLVADFLPEFRKGFYLVRPMAADTAKALFYSNRAVECLEAGHLEDAVRLVEVAVAEDPNCAVAWNIRGVIQRSVGEDGQAERNFLRALAINGQDGVAMGNLEILYRGLGQFELAMNYRRLSLKVRSEDPYFQAFLGEEAVVAGEYDQAVKHLERAIKLQRQEPEFYLELSRVHQLRGRSADAIDVLSKGQKLMDLRDQPRFQGKLAKLRASA